MAIHKGKVSTSATAAMAQAARNLPSAAAHSGIGLDNSTSSVPRSRSSAQARMASAGMRIKSNQGM